MICFIGFVSMVYAIMRKPKDNGTENEIELDNEEQKL